MAHLFPLIVKFLTNDVLSPSLFSLFQSSLFPASFLTPASMRVGLRTSSYLIQKSVL